MFGTRRLCVDGLGRLANVAFKYNL